MENKELDEVLQERYQLSLERIQEIEEEVTGEGQQSGAFVEFFEKEATFLLLLNKYYKVIAGNKVFSVSLEECRKWNRALYEDILEEHYSSSFGNPAYAVERLGEELGPLFCALYGELRGGIFYAAQQNLEQMLIRMELFIEIYGSYMSSLEEEQKVPSGEAIRRILYWYVSDYTELSIEESLRQMLDSKDNLCTEIIKKADLTDLRYLYAYGEYVDESCEQMAVFMNRLPEEKVNLMADTYIEGYRMGFEAAKKDLGRKKTAELRYALGFERMMRRAVENLEKLTLKPVIRRSPVGLLENGGRIKLGPVGACPNRQYDFDHKEDVACIFDKALEQRKLEVYRTVFEHNKKLAAEYAGPAVLETFGEKDFEPEIKKEALQFTTKQQKQWVEYRSQLGEIQRQYIKEEERSFTIIAFPVPEIGPDFEAIFEDVIRINTLDYTKYRKIQQTMIDTLDTGDYVEIRGMNGNQTELRVKLWELTDPEKETIFENCVADVNIPVGEVFTSPKLTGTQGTLHVKRVFLNGLEYRGLRLEFVDGRIQDYSCDNFDSMEENRRYIQDNLLFHRETLPMGEFAIGTNTLAYTCARKWKIEKKMPILIAEKTGPHFAVGDTCYSHAEEIKVLNPDGKEVIARENEETLQRHTGSQGGYFDCHTDITIPYDELSEITVVKKNGERIPVIQKGRFVLPGTEELNEAL